MIGAVRLPTGAHRRSAGTDVVTDLLVLRRREAERDPGPDDWTRTQPLQLDGHPIRINATYVADGGHREPTLGALRVGHGMHNDETLRVDSPDLSTLPDQLRQTLTGIVDSGRSHDLMATERPVDLGPRTAVVAAPGQHWAPATSPPIPTAASPSPPDKASKTTCRCRPATP